MTEREPPTVGGRPGGVCLGFVTVALGRQVVVIGALCPLLGLKPFCVLFCVPFFARPSSVTVKPFSVAVGTQQPFLGKRWL